MRKLGMIGGMAWESTIDYYKLLNKRVNEMEGGWTSPELILYSVNFEKILRLQNEGEWKQIADIMTTISKKLESAGAEAIMLCSNTIHKVAKEVEESIDMPLIHTVDATARLIVDKGYSKVGLMGTRFTMESGFYTNRLKERFGIKTVIPDSKQREIINASIYNEFAKGVFTNERKVQFLEIMTDLVDRGAEGIILGCTEIPLLIKQSDTKNPLFNTLENHINAAVSFITEKK